MLRILTIACCLGMPVPASHLSSIPQQMKGVAMLGLGLAAEVAKPAHPG